MLHFKLELSQKEKKSQTKKKKLCTKIYHIYHAFILIWYLLDSFSTVLAGRTHPLAFQVFSEIAFKILAKSSPFFFTWQAEKHIANSSILTVLFKVKQTNQTTKRQELKGMFSDVREILLHNFWIYGTISSKREGWFCSSVCFFFF